MIYDKNSTPNTFKFSEPFLLTTLTFLPLYSSIFMFSSVLSSAFSTGSEFSIIIAKRATKNNRDANGIEIIIHIIPISFKVKSNIIPAIVKQLNSHLHTFAGNDISCLQMEAHALTTEEGLAEILKDNSILINILNSAKTVRYNNDKKTGVMPSMLGASTAISLGAYTYALKQLDK